MSNQYALCLNEGLNQQTIFVPEVKRHVGVPDSHSWKISKGHSLIGVLDSDLTNLHPFTGSQRNAFTGALAW